LLEVCPGRRQRNVLKAARSSENSAAKLVEFFLLDRAPERPDGVTAGRWTSGSLENAKCSRRGPGFDLC
jgi:hypothetical protein